MLLDRLSNWLSFLRLYPHGERRLNFLWLLNCFLLANIYHVLLVHIVERGFYWRFCSSRYIRGNRGQGVHIRDWCLLNICSGLVQLADNWFWLLLFTINLLLAWLRLTVWDRIKLKFLLLTVFIFIALHEMLTEFLSSVKQPYNGFWLFERH